MLDGSCILCIKRPIFQVVFLVGVTYHDVNCYHGNTQPSQLFQIMRWKVAAIFLFCTGLITAAYLNFQLRLFDGTLMDFVDIVEASLTLPLALIIILGLFSGSKDMKEAYQRVLETHKRRSIFIPKRIGRVMRITNWIRALIIAFLQIVAFLVMIFANGSLLRPLLIVLLLHCYLSLTCHVCSEMEIYSVLYEVTCWQLRKILRRSLSRDVKGEEAFNGRDELNRREMVSLGRYELLRRLIYLKEEYFQ